MSRKMLSVAVQLVVLAWCIPTFPRLAEHRLGYPVHSQPGWPSGLADLLNSPGRVYGYWINGIDHYYYAGDTNAFNEFVRQYVKLKGVLLRLTVHPARAKEKRLDDRKIQYDWKVRVDGRSPREDPRDFVSMEVWLGGQVEPEKMKIPANVKVKSSGEIAKLVAAHRAKRRQVEKKQTTAQRTPLPPAVGTEKPEKADSIVPRSKKPLYAKVALNQDASKVLSVMYDESEGTGKGYDLLYADVDFNGRFEEGESVRKTLHPYMSRTRALPAGWKGWAFSPIPLKVPFNPKAEGLSDPCKITLRYQKYPIIAHIRRTASGTETSEFVEIFEVLSEIRLRQDSTVWEYSFEGSMKPSATLESAPVWSFDDKPKLEIRTRPDERKEGNLGIALNVPAGEKRFQCKKAGQPAKAHVEIKRPDGTVVHKGDETLGKFRFG